VGDANIGKNGSAADNPSGGNSGAAGSSDQSNMGAGAGLAGAGQVAVGNQNDATSAGNSAVATGASGQSSALTDSAGNIIGIQI
jgi:hypothetical protein